VIVSGKKAEVPGGPYLYQGIGGRAFERKFNLAEYVRVTGARLDNGLLIIELAREVPEEMNCGGLPSSTATTRRRSRTSRRPEPTRPCRNHYATAGVSMPLLRAIAGSQPKWR